VPGGRWRLLETIRAYALEKLIANGEAERTARRHAEFFVEFVARSAPGSRVQPAIEDMARYAREIDNVRAALDWAFSQDGDTVAGIVLTAAFAPVWLHLSLPIESRERIQRALEGIRPDLNLSAHVTFELYISLGVALFETGGLAEDYRAAFGKALEI